MFNFYTYENYFEQSGYVLIRHIGIYSTLFVTLFPIILVLIIDYKLNKSCLGTFHNTFNKHIYIILNKIFTVTFFFSLTAICSKEY